MPFGRDPLLNEKQEIIFKKELIKLRSERFSAKQIAKKLKFGQSGPYEKLEVNHIYFYVTKFDLKRKIKKRQKVESDLYKNIPPEERHHYFKWTPGCGIPETVLDSFRRSGRLLNDPLNNE